jgi:hypothetical protein
MVEPKKIIRVDVILEIIDHCAKNAIPKTVIKEDIKNINSDCFTLQISKINVKLKSTKIRLIIFRIILTRALDLENLTATRLVAFLTTNFNTK